MTPGRQDESLAEEGLDGVVPVRRVVQFRLVTRAPARYPGTTSTGRGDVTSAHGGQTRTPALVLPQTLPVSLSYTRTVAPAWPAGTRVSTAVTLSAPLTNGLVRIPVVAQV